MRARSAITSSAALRATKTIKDEAEEFFHTSSPKFGVVQQRNRQMASIQRQDKELIRQAILTLTGVSHYVVRFKCDECISDIPRKFLLDPPEPSVGDECLVEWSGEEYNATVLAMGDEQEAKKLKTSY